MLEVELISETLCFVHYSVLASFPDVTCLLVTGKAQMTFIYTEDTQCLGTRLTLYMCISIVCLYYIMESNTNKCRSGGMTACSVVEFHKRASVHDKSCFSV